MEPPHEVTDSGSGAWSKADPRLKVALDVTAAARQSAGIGRYTRELAVALLTRQEHAYIPFVGDRHGPSLELVGLNVRVRTTPLPHRLTVDASTISDNRAGFAGGRSTHWHHWKLQSAEEPSNFSPDGGENSGLRS